MIGTFGDIVFETSRDKILTFSDFVRKRSATFAEHLVVDAKPRLQFTGLGLDDISFAVRLDASLGIHPEDHLARFRDVQAAGASCHLIIGGKVLGRFYLVSLTESRSHIDRQGQPWRVDLTLTLREDASDVY